MDAGLMRHKVTVQALGEARNTLGEPEQVWVDITTIRASINPLSGREFEAALKENGEVTHKVTIRYNKSVRASMRIKYGDRKFDIMHVIDTWERHQEMVLMCKEII